MFSPRQSLSGTLLIAILIGMAPGSVYAAQDGYCWSDKVGWVNMGGVTYTSATRTLSGTATFESGDGEIDFTPQSSQSIGMTVSSSLSGDVYYISGQAFSEQVGWVVADHGGTNPAALTSAGNLTGNFWSNEAGWFHCSESDVGSANVHSMDELAAAAVTPSVQTDEEGSGARGGRRGSTQNMAEKIAAAHVTILARFRDTKQASDRLIVQEEETQPRPIVDGVHTPLTLEEIAARRGRLFIMVGNVPILYADIELTAWYAPYVADIITQGIAQGYKDENGNLTGEFGVSKSVTKAEVLKMALEAAGKAPVGSPRNVSARGTWASGYVALAESLQLSVFEPSINVHEAATRGEVIQIVLEALDFPIPKTPSSFADVPATHPYGPAIGLAAYFGFIQGDTTPDGEPLNLFRPDDLLNRAEVAKIIALVKEVQ